MSAELDHQLILAETHLRYAAQMLECGKPPTPSLASKPHRDVGKVYTDLLGPTRETLVKTGRQWILSDVSAYPPEIVRFVRYGLHRCSRGLLQGLCSARSPALPALACRTIYWHGSVRSGKWCRRRGRHATLTENSGSWVSTKDRVCCISTDTGRTPVHISI